MHSVRNKAIIDAVDLDTPPWQRETTGLWFDVPKSALSMMRHHDLNLAEAIHAACHAFLNRFALAADLRTECKVPEKEYKAIASQRKRPARLVCLHRISSSALYSRISPRLIFFEPSGKHGGVAAKAFDHGMRCTSTSICHPHSCP